MRNLHIVIIFVMSGCLAPGQVFADIKQLTDVTQLAMPGPLIAGHARIESDCTRCHEIFSAKLQRDLCLDCHKSVAADVESGQGYHGKKAALGQTECRDCHTDHKGREYDIVLLDSENFDHSYTDFELKGAHQRARCQSCHNPDLIKAKVLNDPKLVKTELHKHRNAPDQCIDCHSKTDPHKGQLGNKCQDCHQPEQWSRHSFKHEKTKFKLEGAHQQIACSLCHPKQRWKNIPSDCYSCHRLNDHHTGRYGKKCESCHTPSGAKKSALGEIQSPWKTVSFDHDKTKFKLHDKHQKVRCYLCHTGPLYKQKLPVDCVSCHQTEDPHRGRYGNKCENCHQTTGWKKARFDHDKTKFPLRDKHAKVECEKCHTAPAAGNKLPLDCYSCHKLDDTHRGQQGKNCARCHNQRDWREDVKFEHDLTRFPLIGLHAVAACEACHFETTFKNVPRDCVSCHKDKDEHKQKLGSNCAECHNPNGWNLWQFDHNKQSKFRLDGKHKTLACVACHDEPLKENVKIRMDKSCAGCHQKDDPHRGGFGRSCDRCHTTEAFDQISIKQ
jgi:hypothetical protein